MIKPLNDYILVEEIKEESILIQYSKNDKVSYSKGKVLAVSAGMTAINEGDIVLFSSYALEIVDNNGFIKASDVLAVYE